MRTKVCRHLLPQQAMLQHIPPRVEEVLSLAIESGNGDIRLNGRDEAKDTGGGLFRIAVWFTVDVLPGFWPVRVDHDLKSLHQTIVALASQHGVKQVAVRHA